MCYAVTDYDTCGEQAAYAWIVLSKSFPKEIARIIMTSTWSEDMVNCVTLPKTTAAVRDYLMFDLANIVMGYLRAKTMMLDDLITTGVYEACQCMTEHAAENMIDRAAHQGYDEMVELCMSYCTDSWPLFHAFKAAIDGCHSHLIGKSITKRPSDWSYMMRCASTNNCMEMIKHLVSASIADEKEKDATYVQCLKKACRKNYMELALFMLSIGAKDLNTAHREACCSHHSELSLLLLERGAEKCELCPKA